MRNDQVLDLADCTEFSQALQVRPPRAVHGTVVVVALLLVTALLWAGLTEADLVARARGAVRPRTTPFKVVNAVNGEVLSATSGGRVVEVNFRVGDRVRRGEVLLRLDTERLDAETAKRRQALRAGQEEVAQLDHLLGLTARNYETTRARAEAELAQAERELHLARERQRVDVGLAQVELELAQEEERRVERLVSRSAAAAAELSQVSAKAREARLRLEKARLPIDQGKVEVQRRALEQVTREEALKQNELKMKRSVKQAEVEAARMELAALGLEQRQAAFLAPTDGVVVAGDVKYGDVLERGKPVLEIAELNGFCFEVTVPSEEVGRLRVGLPARVKLDAFDYQKYGTAGGKVTYIAPDSTVPEGQRAAVYLVKIELTEEEVGRGNLRGHVQLGLAGQAEIVTGRESLLALLVKKIRQSISLG
jgi:multidrug resistance efflux pump